MSTSFTSLALLVALGGCIADTIADSDGDGIPDHSDNCVDIANPNQFDSDADGIGDACATCATPIGRDFDHDGYDDACDLCIGEPSGFDSDHDGVDDGCEPCVGGRGTTGLDIAPADGVDDGCTFCRAPTGVDFDQDGLDDACDSCLAGPPHDEDGDGDADACDICPWDPTNLSGYCGFAGGRLLFDPFIFSTTLEPGFSLSNDTLVADSPTEIIHATPAIPIGGVTVMLALARAPIGDGGHAGIVMTTVVAAAGGGGNNPAPVSCVVDADGALIETSPSGTQKSDTTVDPTQPITLALTMRDGIVVDIQCRAFNPDNVGVSLQLHPIDGLRVNVVAQGQATFLWLDAMSGPQLAN